MDALSRYYEIQTSLLRLQQRESEGKEALKQAKFDLRSADEALLTYEGSARSFLDKLTGKREEKTEALRREVRSREAARDALQREQESLRHQQEELTAALETLPSSETLRAEAEQEWAVLEARYCAEALIPLLEKNEKALLEYRSVMRGEYPVLSVQRQQEIYAEPNIWAQRCVPLLQRLKEALDVLRIPFTLGGYYESPVAYLVSAAAKHNRLDRVNQALNQVGAIRKQMQNWK